MNLIELTNLENKKNVINFNHVDMFFPWKDGSGINIQGQNDTFFVLETPAQIEKMLNEVGFFIKRAYKPEL